MPTAATAQPVTIGARDPTWATHRPVTSPPTTIAAAIGANIPASFSPEYCSAMSRYSAVKKKIANTLK